MHKNKLRSFIIFINIVAIFSLAQAQKFEATGPTSPVKLNPENFIGAVKVTFNQLPTSLSFDLPSHFCMVSENGIKFSNFCARTFDERFQGDTLFDVAKDLEGRYIRVWIELVSAARIVVRARYALCNSNYEIAHSEIPSGSPYGDGDWGDEWYYIYPDGVIARHVKLYTGLASKSMPFAFERVPPKVVHQLMESLVIGKEGHVPTDDIETSCVQMIRLVGDNVESSFGNGDSHIFSFDPFPKDFAEYSKANMMITRSKSTYKPFVISLPYGSQVQPYKPEDGSLYPFQTWSDNLQPGIGYISAMASMYNFWHFRRTQSTLEQVYLYGMTMTADPTSELAKLAWSWIVAPELQISGYDATYLEFTYDQAQRAYIVPRTKVGPENLEFSLKRLENASAPMRWVNPAIVVKNWNDTIKPFLLKVNNETYADSNYRYGFEKTASGHDLVLWLKLTSLKSVSIGILIDQVSSTDKELDHSASIFPNPSKDKIFIKLQKPSDTRIEIYSLDGRVCFANAYKSENISIDISDLAKGIYIINIKSQEGTIILRKKVIKE